MQSKQTAILLGVLLCGCFLDTPEATAFIVGSSSTSTAGKLAVKNRLSSTQSQKKKAVMGDDFAGYAENEKEEAAEGAQIAQAFFKELQSRKESSASLESTAEAARSSSGTASSNNSSSSSRIVSQQQQRQSSAGLFDGAQRMTVYSNNGGNGSATAWTPTAGSRRGRLAPLPPPTPTYGSPTKLSISGIISVVLLSKFFWQQALVSAALMAAYVIMVAATSNGGGDWMGAITSFGSSTHTTTMDWSSSSSSSTAAAASSSSVVDGVPVMENAARASASASASSLRPSSTD